MNNPPLQVLRIGQGYTATWTVLLRDERRRPIAPGTYDGSETLALVLTDPIAGDAIDLADSSAKWGGRDEDGAVLSGPEAAALGRVKLAIDDSDTGVLAVGSYPLSITMTEGGEPLEVYRGILKVEARPPYS